MLLSELAAVECPDQEAAFLPEEEELGVRT